MAVEAACHPDGADSGHEPPSAAVAARSRIVTARFGTLVAAGSYNGEVRVWKTADGALVRTFNASPGYTPPVALTATQKK